MFKIHKNGRNSRLWKHERIFVSDWFRLPFLFYTDVPVEILTPEAIKQSHVYIFFRLQSGKFISLPLRTYVTRKFTAGIDAVIKPGVVRLVWTNYETHGEVEEPNLEIVVFVIDRREKDRHPKLSFSNYEEIQPVFSLPE